jgi:hypothetical protein
MAFMTEVLRDVFDPVTNETLLKTSRQKLPAGQVGKEIRARVPNGSPGRRFDYVAFYHHLGIASMNLGFGGIDQGGIYHSVYDSFHWYTSFSDGDFAYGRTLSQVMETSLMRLADAPLLPFEFQTFVKTVGSYVDELKLMPTPARWTCGKSARSWSV